MPASLEAERALLCSVFIDNELMYELKIGPEDFYAQAHRHIFGAMKELSVTAKPIDLITVSDKLTHAEVLEECGGVTYLSELAALLPSASQYKYYLDILTNSSLKRRVIRAAGEVTEYAFDPSNDKAEQALAYAEERIFSLSKDRESRELTHVGETAPEVIHRFQGIQKDPKAHLGLMSGFSALDELTKGFLGGQLIVIAARPGCGKTSFAMNTVGNIAMRSPNKKIAVFSLEMSVSELVQRMICNIAQVSMTLALSGRTNEADFERFWQVSRQLANSNVYIDDSANITPAEIMSKLRRIKAQKGLDLVVIDYLQLLQGDRQRDNKVVEVADISRAMKIMAKELDVPVVLISQMNRGVEMRTENKKPMLSDLRDSGAIEQDADMVMFLNIAEQQMPGAKYKAIELIIAKHRSGPTGEIPYRFYGDTLRFQEINSDAKKMHDIIAAKEAAKLKSPVYGELNKEVAKAKASAALDPLVSASDKTPAAVSSNTPEPGEPDKSDLLSADKKSAKAKAAGTETAKKPAKTKKSAPADKSADNKTSAGNAKTSAPPPADFDDDYNIYVDDGE